VLIGQGANGSVTMDQMQGEKVAIKHINPNATKSFPQLYVFRLFFSMLLSFDRWLECFES
jgi:hypothetical protein